jgi:flagellar hook-length control protein FliK
MDVQQVGPVGLPFAMALGTNRGSRHDALDLSSRALEANTPAVAREAEAWKLVAGAAVATGAEPAHSAASNVESSVLPEFTLREALDSQDFAPALSARISMLVREGIEEARIQINPADMGPVTVRLALEGSDVRVDLAAEIDATRQILDQALPSLASSLRESGFTLTGGGVFQQPRDNGNGNGSEERRRSRDVGGVDARGTSALATATTSATGPGRLSPRGLVDLYA